MADPISTTDRQKTIETDYSRWRERRSPLGDKLGMRLLEGGDGRAQFLLPFDHTNTTVANVVHGGAILSLADSAATAAIWSTVEKLDQYRGLTIDLSMSFISAARGADLLANASVLKRGRSVCYADVEVVTADGELIAKAKVAYKLSKIEQPAETMAGLFAGKTLPEQMALLADLEETGAGVYRTMADVEHDEQAKRDLLASADREIENAVVLRGLVDTASASEEE